MSETSEITGPLVKAIRAIPCAVAHRLHCGGVRVRSGHLALEPKGTPDVLAFLPAPWGLVPVYFETKSRNGIVKPHQEKMHSELRRRGLRVEVPRSFREAMDTVRRVMSGKEAT